MWCLRAINRNLAVSCYCNGLSNQLLLKQCKTSALNFILIKENKSLSNTASEADMPLLRDERLWGHFWFVQVYTISILQTTVKQWLFDLETSTALGWSQSWSQSVGVPASCFDHQTPSVIACCCSCFMSPQNYVTIVRSAHLEEQKGEKLGSTTGDNIYKLRLFVPLPI